MSVSRCEVVKYISPHRYEGRYILANGSPRSFRVDAHNLSDAAAAIERQAREELGADFASSRC